MTTEQGKPANSATPEGYTEFSDVFASLTDAAPASDDKATPAGAAPTPVDEAAAAAKAGTAENAGAASATPQSADAATDAASAGTPTETPAGDAAAAATAAGTAADDAAAAGKPSEDDWKAKYDALVAERAKATPPKDEQPAPAKDEPPIYSADEQTFLKDYEKEWPDVIRGESLRRRAEYRQLATHIFAEVNRVYGPVVQRALETADSFEGESALREIVQAHPDYTDELYEQVVTWTDSLKGYERSLAQGIIKEGSAQDVVDLITRYKELKGIKPAAGGGTQPQPPKASVTELPAAAKKAAKALGVVDSKRGTAAPSTPDANDFDAAWDEAVGAAAK